jgi:hypothetical protein
MPTQPHTDERSSTRIGALRRAARALGALWIRALHSAVRPEHKPWSETLRFPPF